MPRLTHDEVEALRDVVLNHSLAHLMLALGQIYATHIDTHDGADPRTWIDRYEMALSMYVAASKAGL